MSRSPRKPVAEAPDVPEGPPKSRYVEMPTKVLEQFLAECGFERIVQGKEIVYVRSNTYCKHVRVKVYTSIRVGDTSARPVGKDAIRVCAAYEGEKAISPRMHAHPSRSFGLYKATKILRTGSVEDVLDRLYERMRETYAFTNEWVRNHWKELSS